MSRIGRRAVAIPDGVQVALSGDTISVKGPGGELRQPVLAGLAVRVEPAAKRLHVERKDDSEQARCNHGTLRVLIANMITGVTKGFEKGLRISGVGYGAKLQGEKLVMTLGYSHPVELEIPSGIKVTIPAPELVLVRGPDRQKVGHFAAIVRSKRPIEPYNLKGIRYEDEVVKKKAGKTFVSGA
jgi:large subunit ribosomal protein L6